jgi:hypothetical protein
MLATERTHKSAEMFCHTLRLTISYRAATFATKAVDLWAPGPKETRRSRKTVRLTLPPILTNGPVSRTATAEVKAAIGNSQKARLTEP